MNKSSNTDVQYLVTPQSQGGNISFLIAALNARRYYGLETINTMHENWPTLIEFCGCKSRSVPPQNYEKVAKTFGLSFVDMNYDFGTLALYVPSIVFVKSDIMGEIAVLLIKAIPASKQVYLVNYRGRWGPTIEIMKYERFLSIIVGRNAKHVRINDLYTNGR
jgi:hypothetical protein